MIKLPRNIRILCQFRGIFLEKLSTICLSFKVFGIYWKSLFIYKYVLNFQIFQFQKEFNFFELNFESTKISMLFQFLLLSRISFISTHSCCSWLRTLGANFIISQVFSLYWSDVAYLITSFKTSCFASICSLLFCSFLSTVSNCFSGQAICNVLKIKYDPTPSQGLFLYYIDFVKKCKKTPKKGFFYRPFLTFSRMERNLV